ncbi:hypothetical protein DF158_33380 [Burkholderia stagnalis]|nr:hypothetical protein DF158_33380 [Burkholderia stagnalis]RQQ80254.1 hypothetical protein DF134_33470 [Burkholderia stagnalis]
MASVRSASEGADMVGQGEVEPNDSGWDDMASGRPALGRRTEPAGEHATEHANPIDNKDAGDGTGQSKV